MGYGGHLGILFLLFCECLSAQPSTEIDELRRLVQAQRQQIQQQQEQLQEIEKRLESLIEAQAAKSQAAASTLPPANSPPIARPRNPAIAEVQPEKPRSIPWYERYTFRGYTQIRTNRLATSNSALVCEICDHSIGANQNLFIRRARFALSGDLNDYISFYFQPDFANATGFLNFGEIRDLYADIALDKKKQFRIRVGQSKVPYGFEVMQSSGTRIMIDRSDAIDSGTPNERDLGAFLYWAPVKIRRRFAELVDSGLRGSGDFGLFGAGVYNGQGANHPEGNNNMHAIARVTYPWKLKSGQFVEASLQGYTGRYAIASDQRSAGATYDLRNYLDRRVAASFIFYPQPFGIQAEYNIGMSPQYSAAAQNIVNGHLHGGYIQLMFRERWFGQQFIPFIRYQRYSGGMKSQADARYEFVRSTEAGVEWQLNPYLEFTTELDHSQRNTSDAANPDNRQIGTIFRLQLQVNY